MAISTYQKGDKTYWQVYIDLRSNRERSIRVQKRITGLESEKEAISEERKLFRDLTQRLTKLECDGLRWKEVIDRWRSFQEQFGQATYVRTTLLDYVALMRNWTGSWLDRPAHEINRADGREVLQFAELTGKSFRFRQNLKSVIHLIYNWGIEERIINGVHDSPVKGIDITQERGEKIPEILTLEETRTLLQKAKEQNHPWYPIWVAAVYTGCRSGELFELRRSDIELVSREDAIKQEQLPLHKRRYGILRVRRNWNARLKQIGPTKAGYWRSVPISSKFYWFLINELDVLSLQPNDPILPHGSEWRNGNQAQILRGFCRANKLPSIRFHTLRACFATQLISAGIPATVVMKIAGWKDMKTMQRYIRMAGIDEAGATEALSFIPNEEATIEKIVSLIDFRA